MNKRTIKLAAVASLGALALTGCVTDPETGKQRISKAAIGGIGGALGGYLLGDLVGGRNDRAEKILGAGIGAVAGAGVGYYTPRPCPNIRAPISTFTATPIRRAAKPIIRACPNGARRRSQTIWRVAA